MSQVRAGGAYVELTARSAQFLKGLEAAQKRLKSFGASTRLVGTKLTGLGVAAAAPVGASLAVYTSFDDAIRALVQPPMQPARHWSRCVTKRNIGSHNKLLGKRSRFADDRTRSSRFLTQAD